MILVSVGIILRENKILLSQRKKGQHLEFYWEFPGGKVESDESPQKALIRELNEELAIELDYKEIEKFHFTYFEYEKKSVLLLFWLVRLNAHHNPKPQEVMDLKWVTLEDLHKIKLPPANAEVLGKITEEHKSIFS